MKTLVIQSHQTPLPHPWLPHCIDSVKTWAQSLGYQYQWVGDELFESLPPELLAKTAAQKVVATDLARLRLMQQALANGFETVVWCDADFLVFSPSQLVLPEESFALGRETWVQINDSDKPGRLQTHRKVHNAFMMFRQGNSFLDFYSETAERLLNKHPGPYVTQFLGPKLLTALHNIIDCPVIETAGVLSPAVIRDLIAGGGDSLSHFKRRSTVMPAGVNLCTSSVVNGDLSDGDMLSVCALLQSEGVMLLSQ